MLAATTLLQAISAVLLAGAPLNRRLGRIRILQFGALAAMSGALLMGGARRGL